MECFPLLVESPVLLLHSLVRLTSPPTRVVSSSAISRMAVADESRYSMARCWRYLAIGFDDGVPARRDEEEADVLVEPREDMRFHRDLYRGVVVIHVM